MIKEVDCRVLNKAYCDSISSKEACIDKTSMIQFNRINKHSDPHKHISLKMYALSKETALINTMILFYTNHHGKGEYHNAFMIGSMKMSKYYHVTRESRIFYNNEIVILTKNVKFILPYTITTPMDRLSVYDPDSNNYFEQAFESLLSLTSFNSGNEDELDTIHQADKENIYSHGLASRWEPFIYYDAILSLDPYSSIWDDYNTYTMERDTFTLKKDESFQLNNNIDDFDGINRIQCTEPSSLDVHYRKLHSKACLVKNVPSLNGLTVNGQYYPNYKLVIDLTLKVNSLPSKLFFKWRDDERKIDDLNIDLELPYNISSATMILPSYFTTKLTLTSKFEFEMNDNDVIIIGVDLLHHFPKVEYSVVSKEFNVWYQVNILYTQQYEWIEIITVFLLIALLICFFCWVMDINYNAFTILINYNLMSSYYLKGGIYFAFQQVTYEIVSIIIMVVLSILGTIFITSHHSHSVSMFQFDHSTHRQIFGLFLFLSIYHSFILLIIIIMTRETNSKCLNYYRMRIMEYINPYEPTSLPESIKKISSSSVDAISKEIHSIIRYSSFGVFLSAEPEEHDKTTTTATTMARKKRKKSKRKKYNNDDDDGDDNSMMTTKKKISREEESELEEAKYQEKVYRERYHNRIIQSPFPLVLIRNLAFVVIVLSSVICILIFDNNHVYRLYEVVICYLLTFFMSYYIILQFIYLLSPVSRVYNNKPTYILYILFLITEVGIFIGFIAWSMISIHLDYFQHINSIYSELDVYIFVLCLTSALILLSGFVIYAEIDDLLKNRYHIS